VLVSALFVQCWTPVTGRIFCVSSVGDKTSVRLIIHELLDIVIVMVCRTMA